MRKKAETANGPFWVNFLELDDNGIIGVLYFFLLQRKIRRFSSKKGEAETFTSLNLKLSLFSLFSLDFVRRLEKKCEPNKFP